MRPHYCRRPYHGAASFYWRGFRGPGTLGCSTRTVHVIGPEPKFRMWFYSRNWDEVLAIKGTGHLQGTVTQSDNQVLITLPEAELALAEGPLPSRDPGTRGVGTFSSSWTSQRRSGDRYPIGADSFYRYRRYRGTYFGTAVSSGEVGVRATTGGETLASPLPARCLTRYNSWRRRIVWLFICRGLWPAWIEPSGAEQSATKAVKIQDSPTGVNIIVEQHRVTKFRVTVSAQGLELYFAPADYRF